MKVLKMLMVLFLFSGVSYAGTITITIPDNVNVRVMKALGTHYNYQAIVQNKDGVDIANPEKKIDFIKRMIRSDIKKIVIRQEALQASKTAYTESSAKTKTEIDIQ